MSFHSTCRKLGVVPCIMFERMVESPGFDVISYGLSALNPLALPAPPSHTGGVEHDLDKKETRPDAKTKPASPDRPHMILIIILVLLVYLQMVDMDYTEMVCDKTPTIPMDVSCQLTA